MSKTRLFFVKKMFNKCSKKGSANMQAGLFPKPDAGNKVLAVPTAFAYIL